MIEPSTRQCRSWERRAMTVKLKIDSLLHDMIQALGTDHELTDSADNVVSYAEDLTEHLWRYPDMLKARKAQL